MMASEIFEFDAAWAEKWTKTGVPFLSAPTVHVQGYLFFIILLKYRVLQNIC